MIGIEPMPLVLETNVLPLNYILYYFLLYSSPATGSPTTTLLRLHPDSRPHYQELLFIKKNKITKNHSSKADFPGVTGGVYETWSRIHRAVVIRDY